MNVSGAPPRRRLASGRDVAMVPYIFVMVIVAWVTPERWCAPLCRMISRIVARLRRTKTAADERRLAALLGETLAPRTVSIHESLIANSHLRNLYYLRVLRPGGWHPRVELTGLEHIKSAIEAGRGAVVWGAQMVFGDLVTKIALARAGFPLSHLSTFGHGFSSTRFGGKVLNPLATVAEERYLKARWVMAPGSSGEALREMTRRAREKEIISISAVSARGHRTFASPLLGGTAEVATGAPLIARRTGAALLPVFTTRRDDGSFLTEVEQEIVVASDEDRTVALRRAVEEYVGRLARHVAKVPDQYAWLAGDRLRGADAYADAPAQRADPKR